MVDTAPKFDVAEEPGFGDEFNPGKFLGDTTAGKKEARPAGAPRATALEKKLEKFYGGIGLAVYGFDQQCGTVIIANATNMAASLDVLAKQNPEVRKVLERLMETSAYGLVLAAHAPVIFAIASHHVPRVREMAETMAERMHAAEAMGAEYADVDDFGNVV